MIVLIIIGAVILIFAIINWEQSNGFFRKLIYDDKKLLTSNENEKIVNTDGSVSINQDGDSFSHDEVYAYDDDTDYL